MVQGPASIVEKTFAPPLMVIRAPLTSVTALKVIAVGASSTEKAWVCQFPIGGLVSVTLIVSAMGPTTEGEIEKLAKTQPCESMVQS